jgi:hypothetical protein
MDAAGQEIDSQSITIGCGSVAMPLAQIVGSWTGKAGA